MDRYMQSSIYKLSCKDINITDIYIGSTINFGHRKHDHKSRCINPNVKGYNRCVYKFIRANGGWSNWEMRQIEEYKAADKQALERRERFWIEKYKSTLNKYVPTRTMKEYRTQKEYNIQNE